MHLSGALLSPAFVSPALYLLSALFDVAGVSSEEVIAEAFVFFNCFVVAFVGRKVVEIEMDRYVVAGKHDERTQCVNIIQRRAAYSV